MKRRSFFKRLATAAAIVALAPQLCFRQRLQLPDASNLELLPWQDHFGNMLTQMLLVAKQNLYVMAERGYEW